MNKITNAHNAKKTCLNCPAARIREFLAEKEVDLIGKKRMPLNKLKILIQCNRRPELGLFEPNINFDLCPEWRMTPYGYLLKKMRVMILGIDGYLGWPLALKLGTLGCDVSGIDNFSRRDMVLEREADTAVPIPSMAERLQAVRDVLNININFRQMDIRDRESLEDFMRKIMPESIVHYAEIPSAPYSMIDVEHAIEVQNNNVLGTLGLLFLIRDIVPESSLLKLGSMGEYGAPLNGSPIFEGVFPDGAVLKWNDHEWSLAGEQTPRDPLSFYHVSKVQDTFNVYEACKCWKLRSYDIMQGLIYGIHTDEIALDIRLRTRFDCDECFGTMINRFVTQAALGAPITVYGRGGQSRPIIALDDAMECMIRLISSPPLPGDYTVVNQLTSVITVSEMAQMVASIGQRFGLKPQIQQIENPRVEPEGYVYEVVAEKLFRDYGFRQNVSVESEVIRMFELCLNSEILKRIKDNLNTIFPEICWDGSKKNLYMIPKISSDSTLGSELSIDPLAKKICTPAKLANTQISF